MVAGGVPKLLATHWHGAKADSWFSHLAFITPGEDVSNERLDPIEDDVYDRLPTRAASTS